jgi:acetyl esterase/lipase
MNLIRAHAADGASTRKEIAVCGFSAGGHLAASLGLLWNEPCLRGVPGLEPGKNRPNAMILSYPVVSSGPCAHRESFENLLGPDATEEAYGEVSLEKRVTRDAPPAFIWHTADDELVPVQNSLLLASALMENGVPCELHVYRTGFTGWRSPRANAMGSRVSIRAVSHGSAVYRLVEAYSGMSRTAGRAGHRRGPEAANNMLFRPFYFLAIASFVPRRRPFAAPDAFGEQ